MPYQVDLRTGVPRRIAETANLDPRSLVLVEKKQAVYFRDGDSLIEAELAGKKSRTVLDGIEAFCPDTSGGFYVIRQGKLEQVSGKESVPIADNASPPCMARPHGTGCLFHRKFAAGKELWYAPASESGAQPVLITTGRITDATWSSDGQSILFLRDLAKEDILVSEIHEIGLDKPTERCAALTSQFAAFSVNEDGSVFVGASRSKAQPNVVLLLRDVQREMTLCEHRASHPASVRPTFSPDSRRVYFQSDHQGKSAIYSVNVELLVEPTESMFS
jgi:oligogalacturonide lyase